jgi:hypothetical protein
MERQIHLDKEIFEKVKSGKKNFEIRLGNEEIEEGDIVTIIQRDENGKPTESKIAKRVGYIKSTKELPYWSKEDVDKFGFKIIQLGDIK